MPRRPRSARRCLLLLALALCLSSATGAAAASDEAPLAPFPPPLSSYQGEEGLSTWQLLAGRVRAEPLNLLATAIFGLAILHTFLAPAIRRKAHAMLHRVAHDRDGDGVIESHERPADPKSFRVEILHFLGEIEVVFGLWGVPLLLTLTLARGWDVTEHFVASVRFTEPIFVVVIMSMAASRPVLDFAERTIGLLAGLGGRTPLAWWLSILTVGPLLGSFITEPAAMVICAMLLGRQIFDRGASAPLRYATLGLLFVNVSVGGVLTHFAAPPVLMVAAKWGWGLSYMSATFGWKAAIGIVIAAGLYALLFRTELTEMARRELPRPSGANRSPVPGWVTGIHMGFLAWTVLTNHTPALFVGGFLFFLAFTQASVIHQSRLELRSPLLVGFFLAGLVLHGSLQQWWIAPVLGRLEALPLMLGAAALTAFNDNAAITYLASLVPTFGPEMKYAVVAGAVAGGGLTVIANAPNPAGQALLGRYFEGGISPLGLLAGAAVPTAILLLTFILLG
ncbi:MAG: hypothetical protein KJ058_04315 [Thermoanaerobaculia bacterium]|nr:hypothetical protein [Thermoanaerobaculia bacterium]